MKNHHNIDMEVILKSINSNENFRNNNRVQLEKINTSTIKFKSNVKLHANYFYEAMLNINNLDKVNLIIRITNMEKTGNTYNYDGELYGVTNRVALIIETYGLLNY